MQKLLSVKIVTPNPQPQLKTTGIVKQPKLIQPIHFLFHIYPISIFIKSKNNQRAGIFVSLTQVPQNPPPSTIDDLESEIWDTAKLRKILQNVSIQFCHVVLKTLGKLFHFCASISLLHTREVL